MQILVRLLGLLLSAALVTGLGAWILDRTVWDAKYLEQKAIQSQLAEGLASGLPEMLSAGTAVPADSQAMLSSAITPGLVRDQIETLLPQLERYYRDGGSAPMLDLSEVSDRIRRAGLTVPPELAATLDQPHLINTGHLDTPLRTTVRQSQQLVWLAPLAAVALMGLIIIIAGHARWLILAVSMLGAALGSVLLAGLTQLPPRLITSNLATSSAKSLAGPVHAFVAAIAHDQTQFLLQAALVLAIVGVILVLVHLAFKFRHRFGKKPAGASAH